MRSFVTRLSLQPKARPQRTVTVDPTWADVELAIAGLDAGSIRLFELSESPAEASVMTVYGEAAAYHLAIIRQECEQSWVMFGPEADDRVMIGGNLFPNHQVCCDRNFATEIIRCYFESGENSTAAEWFTIELDS